MKYFICTYCGYEGMDEHINCPKKIGEKSAKWLLNEQECKLAYLRDILEQGLEEINALRENLMLAKKAISGQ